mgnify:FL=1
MRRQFRWFLGGILVVGLVTLQPRVTAIAQSVTPIGSYRCTGTQQGQTYELPLVVSAFGDVFRFAWGDPPTILGLGLLHQGVIAVALVRPSTGAVGVALYRFQSGELWGVWSRGDGSIDTEICVVPKGSDA